MTQDQKRALTIGGVGLGALLLWSRTRGGSTKQRVVPVTTTGQVAPYTPQAPVPLQPGESIYDPNSQALLSTPAPIDTTTSLAGPGNQGTAPAAPSYTVNVSYPRTVRRVVQRRKPTKRPVKKAKVRAKK